MRFPILLAAVAVAFPNLLHAQRDHHIYQSCTHIPEFNWSYKIAMKLLQFSVNMLERSGNEIPKDILDIVLKFMVRSQDAVPKGPGTVEWDITIGT
jgi:hypothetical protein